MLYSDEFVASISEAPIERVSEALDAAFGELEESEGEWSQREHAAMLECYALISELAEAGIFSPPITRPNISGNRASDCSAILEFLRQADVFCEREKGKLQYVAIKSRLKTALRSSFAYEFSAGDVERVQQLLNELRELISNSSLFEQTHQRRLLLRLEKLQAEMHKRVGDLDKFWGLLGDAGVAVGKFGDDVKPIVDRIREITGIIWRTQARAEELPSDAPLPLLKGPDSDVAGTE